MYDIDWTPKSLKQLNKIDHSHRGHIVDAVDTLHDFPNAKNVITLTNHKYGYRLRVGNYRVLFDANTTVNIIDIQQVVKRDDNTY